MATAVVLKSESADLYLFAVDDDKLECVKDFIDLLKDQWYVGEEFLYVEEVVSGKFDIKHLTNSICSCVEYEGEDNE